MEEIKELIEFCEKHAITPRHLINVYVHHIHGALNEINSASNESLSVRDNEGEKECNFCESTKFEINALSYTDNKCPICGRKLKIT